MLLRVIVLLGLLAGPTAAHDRGTSYSSWHLRGDEASVTVRLTELDVSRFPWGSGDPARRDDKLRDYLPQRLHLKRGAETCIPQGAPRPLRSAPGHLSFEWTLSCPHPGNYEIRSGLMQEVSPAHLHFARVRVGDGASVERVLSTRGEAWRIATGDAGTTDEPEGTDFLGYLWLGVEHILTGYDHLAFVLALLLTGSSLAEVAKIVTGFTVAHSITLGLMVLGYLQPQREPVEALIGLSIALVAAENLWHQAGKDRRVRWGAGLSLAGLALLAGLGFGNVPTLTLAGLAVFSFSYFGLLERVEQPGAVRWGIAFLFGLVHGFGFAAMLTEAGLRQDRIVAALLGFNLGVELGQLAVVSLIWPLLLWLARRPLWRAWAIELGSAAVLALGMFWFVSRTYG